MGLTYGGKLDKAMARAKRHGKPKYQDRPEVLGALRRARLCPNTAGVNGGKMKARAISREVCSWARTACPSMLGLPLFMWVLAWAFAGKAVRLGLGFPKAMGSALGKMEGEPAPEGRWKMVAVAAMLGVRNDSRAWAKMEAAMVCAWLLPFELLARAWLGDGSRAPRGKMWRLLGASPAPAICSCFHACVGDRFGYATAAYERRGLGGHFATGSMVYGTLRIRILAFGEENMASGLDEPWGVLGWCLASDRRPLTSSWSRFGLWRLVETPLDAVRAPMHFEQEDRVAWRDWALGLNASRAERGELVLALSDAPEKAEPKREAKRHAL